MLTRIGNAIYDTERTRFKNAAVPVMLIMAFLLVFFVFGLFAGMPLMLLISLFALVISVVTVFHDHWILNSLTIPLVALFTMLAISDGWQGWWVPNFCYHIIASVAGIIVFMSRVKTSASLMLVASVFYAAWCTSINLFLDIPAYYLVFGMTFDPVTVFVGSLALCLATSIAATAKNIFLKMAGRDVSCEGGICPL